MSINNLIEFLRGYLYRVEESHNDSKIREVAVDLFLFMQEQPTLSEYFNNRTSYFYSLEKNSKLAKLDKKLSSARKTLHTLISVDSLRNETEELVLVADFHDPALKAHKEEPHLYNLHKIHQYLGSEAMHYKASDISQANSAFDYQCYVDQKLIPLLRLTHRYFKIVNDRLFFKVVPLGNQTKWKRAYSQFFSVYNDYLKHMVTTPRYLNVEDFLRFSIIVDRYMGKEIENKQQLTETEILVNFYKHDAQRTKKLVIRVINRLIRDMMTKEGIDTAIPSLYHPQRGDLEVGKGFVLTKDGQLIDQSTNTVLKPLAPSGIYLLTTLRKGYSGQKGFGEEECERSVFKWKTIKNQKSIINKACAVDLIKMSGKQQMFIDS